MTNYANWIKAAGMVAGALGGYLYWHEIGCLTGHCPIQSHWQTMLAWGGIMGFLLVDLGLELILTIYRRYGNAKKTTLQ